MVTTMPTNMADVVNDLASVRQAAADVKAIQRAVPEKAQCHHRGR
jgi:hypothetical protein